MFGSEMNGRCTSVSGDICNGTSVLNDGLIPALGGVSDDPQSQWAAQLFTMGRGTYGISRIILSFEVEHTTYDRVELTVFNCPERGIYTPVVTVYNDSSFRPEKNGNKDDGIAVVANQTLLNTSCNYLLKYCVEFSDAISSHYLNLEFPYQDNSNFVFLGEVTFLNGSAEPCHGGPINDITSEADNDTPQVTTTEDVESQIQCGSCTVTALTASVVSVIITALLVSGISVAIHIVVYQCVCLLYTSPSPRDATLSRMPSSA